MYKAIVTIVSLLGSIGVFVGVESLDSKPRAVVRAAGMDLIEVRPPALEPTVSLDLEKAQLARGEVVELDPIRITPHAAKAVKPSTSAPPRELRPCSDWEDVGPKALKNPDGTVETRRARNLC